MVSAFHIVASFSSFISSVSLDWQWRRPSDVSAFLERYVVGVSKIGGRSGAYASFVSFRWPVQLHQFGFRGFWRLDCRLSQVHSSSTARGESVGPLRLDFGFGEFSAALVFQLPWSFILPAYGPVSEGSGVSWLVWYTLWREFWVPPWAFSDA
ncbi:MAG: hypothetical protein GY696_21775, partial [Gammaproteobacteria bacterium]|nr:hypothetical protein [Gammaproteobacteria bacterium]